MSSSRYTRSIRNFIPHRSIFNYNSVHTHYVLHSPVWIAGARIALSEINAARLQWKKAQTGGRKSCALFAALLAKLARSWMNECARRRINKIANHTRSAITHVPNFQLQQLLFLELELPPSAHRMHIAARSQTAHTQCFDVIYKASDDVHPTGELWKLGKGYWALNVRVCRGCFVRKLC